MNEDKQAKTKRVAPRPAAIAEPVVQTLPEASTVVALPVPMRRQKQVGETFVTACQATLASIGASQSAVASDVRAMALEVTGIASSNLTAAGDSMTALLGAKSLTDAVEIQLNFARRCLDAFAEGSTRLGEIGIQLANDAAKPLLTPFAMR
jgi:hypothetical protein